VKSIFKATAILSGSSVIRIFLGLVAGKVLAVRLQPAGYGYYGLLQGFLALTTLIASFGMATGLVRLGASAAARNDASTIANLRSGAWFMFAAMAGIVTVILAVFRVTLSRWALGDPNHAGTILLMGVALLFTVAGSIWTGILNAYHRVQALAKSGVITTLLCGCLTIGAVLIWGIHGVVPTIIGGAAIGWAVSWYFLHREVASVGLRAGHTDALKAALALLRFGGPYTASVLLGTGVQLVLPMIVLHLLDANSVGYYKAASAISVGYLGFLVTAMSQDYYPRTSAAADKPEVLARLINEQHRLVMLLAIPMVLGMLALVPIFIPIVYSHKFTPAVEILEWQLIGDIFKFSSWTMAFAILARCSSSVYFLTESIGGVASLLTTWLAVRWFGLSGLGIGFLAAYIVYYFAVWVIIRREIHLVWTSSNKKMMLGAVAAAFVIRILPSTPFANFRTAVALLLAVAVGIPSLFMVWKEFLSPKEPRVEDANEKESPATVTTEFRSS
jgi:PST family polysaccharide transporter